MSSNVFHPIYDEKINTRTIEFKVKGTTVQTPVKAVEKINPKGQVNEFAPHFSQKNIDEVLTGDFGEKNGIKKTGNNLDLLRNKYYVDGLINIMIPTYLDVEIRPDQMSKMESLQYSNSDIMAIPRWEGILLANRPDRTDRLIELTRSYIEGIGPNNKMIIGNIPRILRFNDIQKLMEEYYKLGVTSFIIDCCNYGFRTQLDVQRDIQKKIIADGYMDESLLHSVNVKRSTIRKADVIPADDFLMFGMGIDIIGSMHIPPKGGDPILKSAKIFKSERYSYERIEGISQKDADRIRANNSVAQNLELNTLRNRIKEENTSLTYLRTKDGAVANLEDMLRVNTQRTLSGIFK